MPRTPQKIWDFMFLRVPYWLDRTLVSNPTLRQMALFRLKRFLQTITVFLQEYGNSFDTL
jgi:hypothetical protein